MRTVPLVAIAAIAATAIITPAATPAAPLVEAADTDVSATYDPDWVNAHATRFDDPSHVSSTVAALPTWVGIGYADGEQVVGYVDENRSGLAADLGGFSFPQPEAASLNTAATSTTYPTNADAIARPSRAADDIAIGLLSHATSEDLFVLHGQVQYEGTWYGTMADGMPARQTLSFPTGSSAEWPGGQPVGAAIANSKLFVAAQTGVAVYDWAPITGLTHQETIAKPSLSCGGLECAGPIVGFQGTDEGVFVVTANGNLLYTWRIDPATGDYTRLHDVGNLEAGVATVDHVDIDTAFNSNTRGGEPTIMMRVAGRTSAGAELVRVHVARTAFNSGGISTYSTDDYLVSCNGAASIAVGSGEGIYIPPGGQVQVTNYACAFNDPNASGTSPQVRLVHYATVVNHAADTTPATDPGIVKLPDVSLLVNELGDRSSGDSVIDVGLLMNDSCPEVKRLAPGAGCASRGRITTYVVTSMAASPTASLTDATSSTLSAVQLEARVDAPSFGSADPAEISPHFTVRDDHTAAGGNPGFYRPTWEADLPAGFQMVASSLDTVTLTIDLADDFDGCKVPGPGEDVNTAGFRCVPPVVLKDPQPIALLAAPPTVANAGQDSDAPSFGQSRTTEAGVNTSMSYEVSATVTTEGKIAGNGAEAAIEVFTEFEHGQSLTLSETREEAYGGSFSDDVVVYGATRALAYRGTVVESSTGLGLGEIANAVEVPIATTTASSTITAAREQYPLAFGEWGFGPGIESAMSHTVGDPGTYLHTDTDIDNYCIGNLAGERVDELLHALPLAVDPFGILPPAPSPHGAIRVGAEHAVTAGSDNFEASTIEFGDVTEQSWLSKSGFNASVEVELGADVGFLKAGNKIAASVEVGAAFGGSASFGGATAFSGSVGNIPSPLLSDNTYVWKMFLCKKSIGAGYPIWVLNYTVGDYTGKPVVALGVGANAPRSGAYASVAPDLTFDLTDDGAPLPLDRLTDLPQATIEVEGVSAPDSRVIDVDLTAADGSGAVWVDGDTDNSNDAASDDGTYHLRWAVSGEADLLPATSYRWRVTALDQLEQPHTSDWLYFNTEGPPEAKLDVTGVTGGVITIGDTVTLVSSGATNGLVTDHTFMNGADEIAAEPGDDPNERTWTPTDVGFNPISLTATNAAGSDSDNQAILVLPAGVDDTYDTVEDELLTVDAANGVISNDAGASGAQLADDVTKGVLDFNPDGSFTWQPPADECGATAATSFTYRATSPGTPPGSPSTVALTVTECVNDPTMLAPGSWSMLFGVPEFTSDYDALIAGATDVDGFAETDTVIEVEQPDHGQVDVLDGWRFRYTYTETDDWCGTTTFRARSVASTPGRPDIAGPWVTETFEVICPRAPVTTNVTDTVDEDDVVTGTFAGTDADGDPLTYTVVDEPTHGTVDVTGDTFTYTPDDDMCGTDTFTYRASDGGLESGVSQVTVTVGCLDDPPVAVDDTAGTDSATPIVIDVLANDYDVDNTGEQVVPPATAPEANAGLAIDGVAAPVSGTANAAGGVIGYVPTAGFVGTDTFEYTISDGTSTATAIVTVDVVAPNVAPVATDDDLSVGAGDTLEIAPGDLTANDTDDDGDALTITDVSAATLGTATLRADGVVVYAAPPNDRTKVDSPEVDTFSYTITDGHATSTATVTIEIVHEHDVSFGTVADIEAVAPAGSAGTDVEFATPSLIGEPAGYHVVCTPAAASFFEIGTTTVTCEAVVGPADPAARTASIASTSFQVTVTEGTRPTVEPQEPIEVAGNGGPSVVEYDTPTAVDSHGNPVAVECDPPSGSTFPVGITTVTCTAVDDVDSAGTTTFLVTVMGTDELPQTGGSVNSILAWAFGLLTAGLALAGITARRRRTTG